MRTGTDLLIVWAIAVSVAAAMHFFPLTTLMLALWSFPTFVWRRYGRRPASICILVAIVCTGMLAIGPTT